VPAAALLVEQVERAELVVEEQAAARAVEAAPTVAAWSGRRPEASASAWAGHDSIRSSLPAESDATTKRRARSE
jgi:hypothetical protein